MHHEDMEHIQKLAVVMCTYNRLHLLTVFLQMLEDQIDKHFDLYIWNNNQEVKDLDSFIKHENKNIYSFQIKYHNSPQNIGGIGRFYQARDIADEYDYVIFIDDDQMFDKHLIMKFRAEAAPKMISGWWAHKIIGQYNRRLRSNFGQEADYVGTGGMICPIEIFKDSRLYDDIPEEYIFIEDLWLSFFSKFEYDYRLQRSGVTLKFIPNEGVRDQHHKLKKDKIEFYKYLQNKYNVSKITKGVKQKQ